MKPEHEHIWSDWVDYTADSAFVRGRFCRVCWEREVIPADQPDYAHMGCRWCGGGDEPCGAPFHRRRAAGAAFDVTLSSVDAGAATDALLAIESFAGRVYRDRATDPDQQRRYNALGAIVLPLRQARDEAIS